MKCIRPIIFFYQVKGVHPGMLYTLNEIAAHPLAEVGFNNGNEVILHECGLYDLI